MRVGVVTEAYAPHVSGVSLTVQALARGLVHKGHDIDLIRSTHPNTPPLKASVDVLATEGATIPWQSWAHTSFRQGRSVSGARISGSAQHCAEQPLL